ncbi:MAG: MmgE/PrpD family protein [Burkholderiales bacterium]
MSTLEDRMVDYALELRYDELPETAIHHIKRRVIDTLGGALAAYTAPPVRIARKVALPIAGTGGARIWGSLVRTSPDMAAFVNGSALRYLDINDTHRTIDGSHPSDNLGGVLAVAEMQGASGRDLLLALVISYELQCRFVDSVPFNEAGWDQPVPGVMACALACGRLLGLTRKQMHEALALAIIPNLSTYQSRAGELSMWKGCAAANGARQGVFAAQLAAEGMTGPSEPFDGVFGLWKQTMGKPYDIKPFARGRDALYAVEQSNIKKYPVRDSCQLAVDTARALREKLAGRAISALRIETYRSAYKGAVEDPELWAPRTRETADHSMLVAIAVTLLDGSVTPDTFNSERFKHPEVLDLIQRTKVDVVDDFTRQAPGVRNCRVTATLADGSAETGHVFWTTADIQRGLTDAEIEQKFESLNRDILPAWERRALLDCLWRIDSVDDVGSVVDLLRV